VYASWAQPKRKVQLKNMYFVYIYKKKKKINVVKVKGGERRTHTPE